MAIPLTLVVITGEIDLSFPSIMALGMAFYAIGFGLTGNVWLAVVVCIGVGNSRGALQRRHHHEGRHPFARGHAGDAVPLPRHGARHARTATASRWWHPRARPWITCSSAASSTRSRCSSSGPSSSRSSIWFFLNRHRFGAHVYAVGDNEDSSRLMGIPVDRVKTLTFVIVGGFAALSGLIQSLDVSYFWPTRRRRPTAEHPGVGLPGRHVRLRRHRHHFRHLRRLLHHRRDQRRHRRRWPDRHVDPGHLRRDLADLRRHPNRRQQETEKVIGNLPMINQQKSRFALFFGNRGFFPASLIASAREEVSSALARSRPRGADARRGRHPLRRGGNAARG